MTLNITLMSRIKDQYFCRQNMRFKKPFDFEMTLILDPKIKVKVISEREISCSFYFCGKNWGFPFEKKKFCSKWPWFLTSRSRSRTYLDVKFNALSISVVKIWGSYLKKSIWHWNNLDPWPQGQDQEHIWTKNLMLFLFP